MVELPVNGLKSHAGQALAVCIVTTNARDELHACLDSLRSHPYRHGPMEIIVLDNASDDRTLELLRKDYPEVVVVEETVRRGFGANQNRAVEASRGELLFILNPDTVVHDGTIDRLVSALDWSDDVVASGGPILHRDGTTRQDRPNEFLTPIGAFRRVLGRARASGSSSGSGGVFSDGWVSGGSFVITREVFVGIGGFDETFFIYAEDLDLFKRLSSLGFSFAWVDDAPVTHPLPAESPSRAKQRAVEGVRSEALYMGKHYGWMGTLMYRLAVVAGSIPRFLMTLPPLAILKTHSGAARGWVRASHLGRLEEAVRPGHSPGMREVAARWNRRQG